MDAFLPSLSLCVSVSLPLSFGVGWDGSGRNYDKTGEGRMTLDDFLRLFRDR